MGRDELMNRIDKAQNKGTRRALTVRMDEWVGLYLSVTEGYINKVTVGGRRGKRLPKRYRVFSIAIAALWLISVYISQRQMPFISLPLMLPMPCIFRVTLARGLSSFSLESWPELQELWPLAPKLSILYIPSAKVGESSQFSRLRDRELSKRVPTALITFGAVDPLADSPEIGPQYRHLSRPQDQSIRYFRPQLYRALSSRTLSGVPRALKLSRRELCVHSSNSRYSSRSSNGE